MTGVHAVLAGGVVVTSTAAVLVRLADPMPPLAVAALRTAAAAAMLPLLLALFRSNPVPAWRGANAWPSIAAGLCLALHFGCWITSVRWTSVANAAVLTATVPVFAALLARVNGDRVGPRAWLGIAVALVGTAVVVAGTASRAGGSLAGDAMALLAAAAAAAYLTAGRSVRGSLSLLPYLSVVYPVCAVALLGTATASETPLAGWPIGTYVAVGAMALGPQLIGHSSFNWAVRHVPPHVVAVFGLLEPPLAALLAWAVLAESPPLATFLGAPFLLVGAYLAATSPPTG